MNKFEGNITVHQIGALHRATARLPAVPAWAGGLGRAAHSEEDGGRGGGAQGRDVEDAWRHSGQHDAAARHSG